MLYVFFGTERGKVRQESHKKIDSLRGDSEPFYITGENGTYDMLVDALGATSLFGGVGMYVLDMTSENEEFFESVLELGEAMRDSVNTFVIVEGALTAKESGALEKVSTTCERYDSKEKKEWNVFALSDALLHRDKKTLWILLMEAWRSGRASEEIIGTLFWQLKILGLAEKTRGADEAKQKPFVYDKARRSLRLFKEGELNRITHDLVLLYHKGHSGENIDHALERWVLAL